MRAPSLLRSQAFRIVLLYVVLFAASAAALVAFTYWNTTRALDAQTDQIIEAEITGLSEQYQRQGLQGLTEVIMDRSVRGGPDLYLLSDDHNHPIAGNLDSWPPYHSRNADFVDFEYERRNGGEMERRRARGRVFALTGGFQLLVARDIHERYETGRLFSTTLPWSVGLMLMLGLIGGALISRNILARLDVINSTSSEIIAGDLSRRVPLSRRGDEFDELAANLNRMLDRIERLMKSMREVTVAVAHDLRTPLNRLRNRLEGTLKLLDPASPETTSIDAAVAETDRLIATFNGLLLIAEAESGVVRDVATLIDLGAVVEGVAELYEPLAEENGLTLEVVSRNGAMIRGNQNLLSQALANLLDNAIKYTPSGGHITVSIAESQSIVSLTVADTGPGIPAKDRERVLERFVRLDESRNSPGTGLGLSLVAAIAQLHGAEFVLSDNSPGLRATLKFASGNVRQIAARPPVAAE